jgi:hypothetical protein
MLQAARLWLHSWNVELVVDRSDGRRAKRM